MSISRLAPPHWLRTRPKSLPFSRYKPQSEIPFASPNIIRTLPLTAKFAKPVPTHEYPEATKRKHEIISSLHKALTASDAYRSWEIYEQSLNGNFGIRIEWTLHELSNLFHVIASSRPYQLVFYVRLQQILQAMERLEYSLQEKEASVLLKWVARVNFSTSALPNPEDVRDLLKRCPQPVSWRLQDAANAQIDRMKRLLSRGGHEPADDLEDSLQQRMKGREFDMRNPSDGRLQGLRVLHSAVEAGWVEQAPSVASFWSHLITSLLATPSPPHNNKIIAKAICFNLIGGLDLSLLDSAVVRPKEMQSLKLALTQSAVKNEKYSEKIYLPILSSMCSDADFEGSMRLIQSMALSNQDIQYTAYIHIFRAFAKYGVGSSAYDISSGFHRNIPQELSNRLENLGQEHRQAWNLKALKVIWDQYMQCSPTGRLPLTSKVHNFQRPPQPKQAKSISAAPKQSAVYSMIQAWQTCSSGDLTMMRAAWYQLDEKFRSDRPNTPNEGGWVAWQGLEGFGGQRLKELLCFIDQA